jgi:pyruvate dehydrogenase E1 component alpha subunit
MTEEKMEAIDEEIRAEVDRVYEEADQSPHPEPEEVYADVYTDLAPERGH